MRDPIENFGRNIRFQPKSHYLPASESEVLDILARHRGEPIRVVGRLHSWSQLVTTNGVTIDLRNLNSVSFDETETGFSATVGAGCQVKRLLHELKRSANITLPSIGLIDEQSVAGAISTGTHGSGKHSLSHYVEEVRVAHYLDNGNVTISTINAESPKVLQAARCSLGLLGVILSVRFTCRKNYRVEEHMRRYESLQQVLEQESTYPLQQFFLIPWAWCYFAQHRRETTQPVSRTAWMFHFYWYWMVDVLMHLGICLTSRWLPNRSLAKLFFRYVAPSLTMTNWRVVDDAHKMLVMEHELFWHIEIEIFVQTEHLPAAMEFIESVLNVCDGQVISNKLRDLLATHDAAEPHAANFVAKLEALRDRYTHNYPICVRRILPDDTMISMASRHEVYSISFINFASVSQRGPFLALAEFLAESTARLFDARPHWGKLNPLSWNELHRLYPSWPDFQSICEDFDSAGSFRNERLSAGFLPPQSDSV